jgi:hypothetical protein
MTNSHIYPQKNSKKDSFRYKYYEVQKYEKHF